METWRHRDPSRPLRYFLLVCVPTWSPILLTFVLVAPGHNQLLMPEVAAPRVWRGITAKEAAEQLGNAAQRAFREPDQDPSGGFYVHLTENGWGSLLVPQHAISLHFSDQGRLTYVMVEYIYRLEEQHVWMPLSEGPNYDKWVNWWEPK